MSDSDFWGGIALKGDPNSATNDHDSYYYDANGDLKINKYALRLTNINGEYKTIFVDVPANLRGDNYVSAFDPTGMVLEPGSNIVTLKAEALTPRYVQNSDGNVTPGWNPATSPPMWLIDIDAHGNGVYGDPPASAFGLPGDLQSRWEVLAVAFAKSVGYVRK